MDKERDQSRFIIQRFDNYINAVNLKGNFLLGFNTFLVGGIITNSNNIMAFIESPSYHYLVNICLVILFVLSITATVIIIKAVYPFLVSGNSSKEKYHSHIFFNAIAEFSNAKEFCESYSKQSDDEVNADFARQVFHLASGLKRKYHLLEWAMRFVYMELTLLVILVTILIKF